MDLWTNVEMECDVLYIKKVRLCKPAEGVDAIRIDKAS